MKLYLARHGQTDWNLAKRLQGSTDVPLNRTGRAQAGALARALSARAVSFAFGRASPLGRARETIAIALAGTGVSWVTDERLREIALGDYEGHAERELRESLGATYEQWRSQYFRVAAPNGERLDQAVARVGPLLEEIAGQAGPDDCILVVAHQAINIAVKVWLSGAEELDALAGFAQANDEVDVWEYPTREYTGDDTGDDAGKHASGRRLERFETG